MDAAGERVEEVAGARSLRSALRTQDGYDQQGADQCQRNDKLPVNVIGWCWNSNCLGAADPGRNGYRLRRLPLGLGAPLQQALDLVGHCGEGCLGALGIKQDVLEAVEKC